MVSDIDVSSERLARARIYGVIAVVCGLLAILFLWRNVFLTPVFGVTGLVCALLGIRNGGNKLMYLALFLLNGAPALLAGIALISLLPNLPSLKLGHIQLS